MIRFLYGRTGTGKTTAILDEIAGMTAEKPIYLLVPDRAAVQTERAVACRELGGHTDVLTFTRLCNLFFRRYGGICKTYIDKGAKRIVMGRTLESLSSSLSEYGSVPLSDTRTVETLVSMRTELCGSRITPDDLQNAAETITGEDLLSRKLHDLSLIFSAYESEIRSRYDDPDSTLSEVATRLCGSGFFAGSVVYIDAFSFFTAVQYDIIEEIFREADNVTVSLAYDPEHDASLAPFYSLAQTDRRLHGAAKASGKDVAPDRILRTPWRYENEALSHLAENLWAKSGKTVPFDGDCSPIRLICAKDALSEAEAVALDIAKKVRAGARYRDFAVVMRDRAQYDGILDAVLKKYEIPFFLSAHSDMTRLAPIRFLSAALDVCRRGFLPEHVISYLKTGLCGIEEARADALETYLTRWHISGKALRSGEDFTMSPNGYEEAGSGKKTERLADINATRRELIEPLHKLNSAIHKTQSVREHCRVLYEFWSAMQIPERTEEMQNLLLASGEPGAAAELARSETLFCNLLDSLVACAGDACVPLDTFAVMFRMMTAETAVSVIPTSIDEVLVTEVSALNFADTRYVYLVGTAEGSFPKRLSEEGFFSEREKEILHGAGIDLAMRLPNRLSDELLYFYSAAASPRAGLTVLYPQYTDAEKNCPSSPVERMKVLFPNLKTERFENLSPLDRLERPLPSLEFALSAGGILREKIRAAFRDDERYRDRFRYINEPLSARCCALSPETANALFGSKIRTSYSRLEKYIKCHFFYFCDSELRLADCSKIKFDNLNLGNFVHKLLEKVTPLVLRDGERDPDKIDAALKNASSAYLRSLFADENAPVPGRLLHIADYLCRCTRIYIDRLMREFDQSRFRATGFEIGIGEESGKISPMTLENEHGSVSLSGVIDRLDVWDAENGETFVRIADYKTGNKTFDLEKIRRGLDLQMPLYLFSVCESGKKNGKEPIPAGILYIGVKPKKDQGEFGEEESHLAAMASGLLIDDPEVLRAMEESLSGEFIPVRMTQTAKEEKLKVDRSSELMQRERFADWKEEIASTVLSYADEIRTGNAAADPQEDGGKYPCRYCPHKAICRAAKHET